MHIKNIIYFIIFILILIIIGTITKKIEKFENELPFINSEYPILIANLRPCEIYLTEQPQKCNELKDIYKLGKIQLQVLINVMKKNENYNQIVENLEKILELKNIVPVNSCKFSFDGLYEVDKVGNNKYEYKTATKHVNYDLKDMKGYCLMKVDTDSKSSVIENISKKYKGMIDENNIHFVNHIQGDNNTYAAVKIKSEKILSNNSSFSSICKKSNNNIDNERFLRLHCDIYNDNKLLLSYIDIVSYNKKLEKFEIIDFSQKKSDNPPSSEPNNGSPAGQNTSSPAGQNTNGSTSVIPKQHDTDKIIKEFNEAFFELLYIENKTLSLSCKKFETSLYTFTFNECNNIEKYEKIEYIYDKNKDENVRYSFNFNDFNISGKSITNSLKLPFKSDTKTINDENSDVKMTNNSDGDISRLLQNKIDNAEQENKAIEDKIKEFESQLNNLSLQYQANGSLCNDEPLCLKEKNEYVDKMYKIITKLKNEYESSLRINKDLKNQCIDILLDIDEISMKLSDINNSIEMNIQKTSDGKPRTNGMRIDYSKFSKYVSNDDCIYIKF